jgi:hypothetical protein
MTLLEAYQNHYSPTNYYYGALPTLTIVNGGDQRGGPATGVLPVPLCVRVNSGDPNAPLTFAVVSGGALLSSTNDGSVRGKGSVLVFYTEIDNDLANDLRKP